MPYEKSSPVKSATTGNSTQTTITTALMRLQESLGEAKVAFSELKDMVQPVCLRPNPQLDCQDAIDLGLVGSTPLGETVVLMTLTVEELTAEIHELTKRILL